MDELDQLKSHWKKNEETYPKVSESDIYAMLHKRSSSIVKWILIISVIEFAFWGLVSLSNSIFKVGDYASMPKFIWVLDYINYAVVITFIVLFYINYRKISSEKPVKDLLNNIIRVRKIVTAYVVYNVIMIFISMMFGMFIYTSQHYEDTTKSAIVISIVVILILLGFIALLYYLLYGRLIKKLNKNYGELKKMQQK